MVIAVLGIFCCIFRIKSDATEIIEHNKMNNKEYGEMTDELIDTMEELNLGVESHDVAHFLDLGQPTAYADLVVNAFGVIAFLCVLIGAQKRSAKLLVPALVFIPIDFLKCIFFSIIFAIPLGLSNPFSIALIVLNFLNALIYVPEWIAIYSLRHELLESDSAGDYELAQQQGDK